jgi:predicted ABC-type ATPase
MPRLIVVAGVNGSGKSTLTQKKRFNKISVIDPDAIAKEIDNNTSASARGEGGRAAIKRRREFVNADKSFVLETTLAGQSTYRLMRSAQTRGYRVELHYIYLTDANQSAERVNTRVSKGGHDIPKKDIIRRFQRSRDKFEDAALISDMVFVYDNTSHEDFFLPVLIAEADNLQVDPNVPDWLISSISRICDRAAENGGQCARIWRVGATN